MGKRAKVLAHPAQSAAEQITDLERGVATAARFAVKEEQRRERRLKITKQTATLLGQAQAALNAAQANLNLVAAATLAQHGLDEAQILRVEAGEPPILVVRIAANGKGA